jgi:ABC-type antimicrobial peptide transport system permease subunit
LFPDVPGYRFFLLQVPPPQAGEITGSLEDALSDYGFDIVSTQERLAAYHRVENTYLSTFQALGALGLVLGTIGLAAIVLRNVLERRRQLAMLRAVGYDSHHLRTMALAENALLLVLGLFTGALCALLAVAPAAAARGGRLPSVVLALLLGCVLASGLAAAVLATMLALRSPLLAALRSE